MRKIINLTMHDVNIDGMIVKPSGTVARVDMDVTDVGAVDFGGGKLTRFVKTKLGKVTDLPPYSIHVKIVSNMVRVALPDRSDLASPFDLIRDDKGIIIGANKLVINL